MLPKFDQLTHCYTLFTVSDVGETGKNEGGEEEVVSTVSIAHDLRKWLRITRFRLPFLQKKSSTDLKVLSSLLNGPLEALPSGAGRKAWQKMKKFLTSPEEQQKLLDKKNHKR